MRQLDETLALSRTGQHPILPPISCVERVEKPKERPPTPTVDEPAPEARRRRRAVVLLQSILRGRAAQNRMYEGREQRQDLISELRSTHALQEAQQAVKAKEAEAVKKQREREVRAEGWLEGEAQGVEQAMLRTCPSAPSC